MDQAENLRNIIKKENAVPKHVSRVMTVTSGKGGVGKSSVSVNLAIALAKRGKKVVVLDADFGLANIEIMLGIHPKYTLADLMFNGKTLSDVITAGEGDIGFISGGSGIREMTELSQAELSNLTARLRKLDSVADIIIIDTGAGISGNVMEFIMSSSEVFLVATPEPTSITDAYALLKTLGRRPDFIKERSSIKLIANKVVDTNDGLELYSKLSGVSEKFLDIPLQYTGAVPFDANISRSVMKQVPVMISYPSSPSAIAIEKIAESLMGDMNVDPTRADRGFAAIFKEAFTRAKGRG